MKNPLQAIQKSLHAIDSASCRRHGHEPVADIQELCSAVITPKRMDSRLQKRIYMIVRTDRAFNSAFPIHRKTGYCIHNDKALQIRSRRIPGCLIR